MEHESAEQGWSWPEEALQEVLRFLEYMRVEKGASPHTLAAYERNFRLFAEWMGERFETWQSCTAEVFRAWLYEAMQQQLKPASIRQRFASLRSLYAYCGGRG